MRSVILVSSRTGNTWKIARCMRRALGADCRLCRSDEAVDVSDCDLVLVGFWLDSGYVDADAAAVLQRLQGKKTAIFATMGGDPHSEPARKVMQSAVDLLLSGDRGNQLLGTFMCRGRVSAAVLQRMYELFPHIKDDPAHQARIKAAAVHPDANDRLLAELTAARWLGKAARAVRGV